MFSFLAGIYVGGFIGEFTISWGADMKAGLAAKGALKWPADVFVALRKKLFRK